MRALIVDDSKPARSMMRLILEQVGFEVEEAEDAASGLGQLIDMQRPDIALIDWNMPGDMNGVDLVRKIREDDTFSEVRLLMVTTETEMDYVVSALDAGADEYVMKPFTRDIILEKLKLVGIEA